MKPPPLDKELILHLKQLPITFIWIKKQKQSVCNIVVMICKWMVDDGGSIHIAISKGFPLQMEVEEYYITFNTSSTHSKSKA